MSRISYSEFVTLCDHLLRVSAQLGDGWTWRRCDGGDGKYLERRQVGAFKLPACDGVTHHCHVVSSVCHIVYSHSYGVPTLYFNHWLPTGELLPVDTVWRCAAQCGAGGSQEEQRRRAVTQCEHPILGRPTFYVHPCHTAALMASQRGSQNYLITWLSCVLPLTGLTMDIEYGQHIV